MGANSFGTLGLNQSQPTKVSSPTQIGSGTNWSSISSGLYSIFAVKTDGTLWSWGYNNVGTAYTFKSFGYDYQLWTWGYNGNGQLGQNSPTYYSSPVQIPGTTWRRAGSRMGQAYSCWATKTD